MKPRLGSDPDIPAAETSDTRRNHESVHGDGSGFDLIKIVHQFLLDGTPPFYLILKSYSAIRHRYFLEVTFKIGKVRFRWRFGSILRWLLDHLCYLLDIIIKIAAILFILGVLVVLLLALMKLLGVTNEFIDILKLIFRR